MIEYRGEHKVLPTHSLELIRSLKGCSILKMFKSLEWEKQNVFEAFVIEENKLFELAYGRLFIELDDGRLLCLFSNNKRISVTISLENKEMGLRQSGEIIDCTHEQYSTSQWAEFIGQQIESIEIIKVIDEEYGNNMGMNERGLQFNLKSGEFVFTQALIASGPGSTVIMKRTDIADGYIDCLDISKV